MRSHSLPLLGLPTLPPRPTLPLRPPPPLELLLLLLLPVARPALASSAKARAAPGLLGSKPDGKAVAGARRAVQEPQRSRAQRRQWWRRLVLRLKAALHAMQ
jgi:hypothetical protein